MLAGCALVGGETAEHPGLLGPDEYDLAGAGTGVVEADARARPRAGPRGRRGDRDGRPPALHSNGYSLVRHVLLRRGRLGLDRDVAGVRPHPRRGAAGADPDLLPGLPGAGPRDRGARVLAHHRRRPGGQPGPGPPGRPGRRAWTAPPGPRRRSSDLVGELGRVAHAEMERTFNMGVGMVAIVPPAAVDAGARAAGRTRGVRGLGAAARSSTAPTSTADAAALYNGVRRASHGDYAGRPPRTGTLGVTRGGAAAARGAVAAATEARPGRDGPTSPVLGSPVASVEPVGRCVTAAAGVAVVLAVVSSSSSSSA